MDVSGEYRLSVSRQAVWNALLDPEILQQCIPGCESFEKLADDHFQATVKTAIGPVKATFTSELRIVNPIPPESYRLEGEGKAGAVGFGRGAADVTLREEGGETVLSYSADFQVGGRLAQIGSRLVVGATRKIADQFFGRLAGVIDEQAERLEPPRKGIGKELVWVAVTVILVAALIWWLITR
ncbi:MAG: carbon monoxide dehydrogenase subunit G [Rhodospirillaceae bacterium]|nr:carbon monoxide dehydrogenase subunit G [Rhodospirillaceae bacterium]MDE0361852.1 carbon monoxide dehydrogenase subunit G [Rhodospirillaceae bacterium]